MKYKWASFLILFVAVQVYAFDGVEDGFIAKFLARVIVGSEVTLPSKLNGDASAVASRFRFFLADLKSKQPKWIMKRDTSDADITAYHETKLGTPIFSHYAETPSGGVEVTSMNASGGISDIHNSRIKGTTEVIAGSDGRPTLKQTFEGNSVHASLERTLSTIQDGEGKNLRATDKLIYSSRTDLDGNSITATLTKDSNPRKLRVNIGFTKKYHTWPALNTVIELPPKLTGEIIDMAISHDGKIVTVMTSDGMQAEFTITNHENISLQSDLRIQAPSSLKIYAVDKLVVPGRSHQLPGATGGHGITVQ